MKTEGKRDKSQISVGKGIGFQRTRRITGYLSYLDRFNNAKRAEAADRLIHPSF